MNDNNTSNINSVYVVNEQDKKIPLKVGDSFAMFSSTRISQGLRRPNTIFICDVVSVGKTKHKIACLPFDFDPFKYDELTKENLDLFIPQNVEPRFVHVNTDLTKSYAPDEFFLDPRVFTCYDLDSFINIFNEMNKNHVKVIHMNKIKKTLTNIIDNLSDTRYLKDTPENTIMINKLLTFCEEYRILEQEYKQLKQLNNNSQKIKC